MGHQKRQDLSHMAHWFLLLDHRDKEGSLMATLENLVPTGLSILIEQGQPRIQLPNSKYKGGILQYPRLCAIWYANRTSYLTTRMLEEGGLRATRYCDQGRRTLSINHSYRHGHHVEILWILFGLASSR